MSERNEEIAKVVQEYGALWSDVRKAEPMQQVRRIMREKGVSNVDLAVRIGVPEAWIEQVVCGGENINIVMLYSLADALEVPLTITFGES